LWKFFERKTDQVSFLVTIGGINVSKNKLKLMKANAYSSLVLSVKNKLFKVVADINDPAEQWAKLAAKYMAGDYYNKSSQM
jgi:hypothetical protein